VTFKAVLFDVGGPLDTEVQAEALIDAQIRAGLEAAGIHVSDDDYRAANDWAVASFAPDAYSAIIWRLAGGNERIAREVRMFSSLGRDFELREGMAELLHDLHAAGLKLGLAANQPPRIIARLDEFGVGHLFHHREVSGHHGYRKPDVRLFLRACEDLHVDPAECVMVGDRVDNDIFPARTLGMRTVLFRTGRHINQQPRSVDEVPDVEVRDVAGLRKALASITRRPLVHKA
jgi:putative hydrolase of the HAD superfamily